jgi:hypothetical protein
MPKLARAEPTKQAKAETMLTLSAAVTKPYKFIGFGAMEVTKPYKSTGFGAMEVTKPYKIIGFGAKPIKPSQNYASLVRLWGPGGDAHKEDHQANTTLVWHGFGGLDSLSGSLEGVNSELPRNGLRIGLRG